MRSRICIIHADVEIVTIYEESSVVLCSSGNHCPNTSWKTDSGKLSHKHILSALLMAFSDYREGYFN